MCIEAISDPIRFDERNAGSWGCILKEDENASRRENKREISHQRRQRPGPHGLLLVRKSRAAIAAMAREASSEPLTQRQVLLIRRRNRRKVDFKTLDGVLRESTRNYLDLLNGDITLDQAECRGRAIARHGEILKSKKQEGQILELLQQLKEVRGAPRIGWDVDEIT